MKNEILKREIENNWDNHEIFEYQNHDDLKELKKILDKSDKDVVIELKEEDIYYEVMSNKKENKESWENVISKSILTQIRNKYLNMEVPNEPINRIKTFNHIRLINPKELRLHIIIDKSCIGLCEELLNYIDDIVPFKTMLYLEQGFKVSNKVYKYLYDGKYYMWDAYDYKIFNGKEEGITSKEIRKLERKK